MNIYWFCQPGPQCAQSANPAFPTWLWRWAMQRQNLCSDSCTPCMFQCSAVSQVQVHLHVFSHHHFSHLTVKSPFLYHIISSCLWFPKMPAGNSSAQGRSRHSVALSSLHQKGNFLAPLWCECIHCDSQNIHSLNYQNNVSIIFCILASIEKSLQIHVWTNANSEILHFINLGGWRRPRPACHSCTFPASLLCRQASWGASYAHGHWLFCRSSKRFVLIGIVSQGFLGAWTI